MHPMLANDMVESHHRDLVAAAEAARVARSRRAPGPFGIRARRLVGSALVSAGNRLSGSPAAQVDC